jgi:Ca-activated chloride channel family protein
MKINAMFEKNKLNQDGKETLCLIDIFGEKKKTKISKRKPLNISLVIDISGSMGLTLDGQNNNYMFFNNMLGQAISKNQPVTPQERPENRLDLAKKSTQDMIHSLQNGDIVSVVAFDSNVDVIVEAITITDNNKEDICSKIATLQPNSATNLHGGWIKGVEEVSKNIKSDFINRVILFSDGNVNVGETNIDVISTDALNIAKQGITTSTFGIGSDFNEDLLQAMSDSGSGNSYYISNSEEFASMLESEFSGLMNVIGKQAKITFKPSNGVTIVDDYNQYKKDEDHYLVGNLLSGRKLELLFKLSYKTKAKTKMTLGLITLQYTDDSGKEQTIEYKVNANLVTAQKWDKLDFNEDVKVKDVLLTVAKRKTEMVKQMDLGNFDQAKQILSGSSALVGGCGIISNKLDTELESLNTTIAQADSMDRSVFRKSMSYQSYETKKS